MILPASVIWFSCNTRFDNLTLSQLLRQSLCDKSSANAHVISTHHWCSSKKGVQLLLVCIKKIGKCFAAGQLLPCTGWNNHLSMPFMFVAIISFFTSFKKKKKNTLKKLSLSRISTFEIQNYEFLCWYWVEIGFSCPTLSQHVVNLI